MSNGCCSCRPEPVKHLLIDGARGPARVAGGVKRIPFWFKFDPEELFWRSSGVNALSLTDGCNLVHPGVSKKSHQYTTGVIIVVWKVMQGETMMGTSTILVASCAVIVKVLSAGQWKLAAPTHCPKACLQSSTTFPPLYDDERSFMAHHYWNNKLILFPRFKWTLMGYATPVYI